MEKILHYNIVLRPEPEGGFTVIVPSLPGCVTYGKTLKKAKAMAVDAVNGYLLSLKKHGEPIVSDTDSFAAVVDIKNRFSKKPAYA